MKLFLLRPKKLIKDNPWDPWYDKSFGFVVRAKTEIQARKMAHEKAGDENSGGWGTVKYKTKTPWLDEKYSTCTELIADGPKKLIIRDQHNS